MAKNLPNLKKEMEIHMHEAKDVSNKMNKFGPYLYEISFGPTNKIKDKQIKDSCRLDLVFRS